MFESFVEKFQYVQDEISSSFRGLALGEPIKPKLELNFEAGCSLLAKYQDAWEELHLFGENNAQLARKIDSEISKTHRNLLDKKAEWAIFQKECNHLEKMRTEVETVVNTLGDLRNLCTDIEEGLINLENLIELQEIYKNEAQEKIKLSNYRVDKLQYLDAFREVLAEEHIARVHEMEQAEMSMKQTKQTVFQAKFREDLEFYKRTGALPQAETPKSEQSQRLEEVTLDDAEGAQLLEEYLKS